jgi:hypothetical protein
MVVMTELKYNINDAVKLLVDEIVLEPLAWPKERAVVQCKRLMKQVTDLITIYELKAEDFL